MLVEVRALANASAIVWDGAYQPPKYIWVPAAMVWVAGARGLSATKMNVIWEG